MFSKNIFYLLLIVCCISCSKDDDFPVEPSIAYVAISPPSPQQYTDSITITITYEDGDGDLGENNSQAENCFVTDNRLGITYKLRIQQLAPGGTSIAIKGTLNVKLGGQAITDGSNEQSVTYNLYIKDRAGHASNTVTTGAISIRR